MTRLVDGAYRLLEVVLVLLLAGMVALVFANAAARYLFDYTIRIADELPRFMFVWLSFIGAAVAHRRGMHLGMKFIVSAMPRMSWRTLMAISEFIILCCCIMLVWGGILAWRINSTMLTPILGVPLAAVHAAAMVSAALMAITSTHRLFRVATGRFEPGELERFAEQEEAETEPAKGRFE
ncbi:TRAP transporter small permease [Arsenicitalea aurantiaca]|uniref:TRAP transporter small permease protein n=1 Tax=Arsenicitalea aurantiaca TaxID=1783274 RepID=A0A433XFA4_9HYPH|nr:TRAP transporter small permease [Arsenicitalea aurantiaca]RUT32736.1 TRAP transporter small permease [Arsenicitalea aurantiaca]